MNHFFLSFVLLPMMLVPAFAFSNPSVPVGVQINFKFQDRKATQTIVFINGNGSSLETFLQVAEFMPVGMNYLLYDQRGQGKSFYHGIDFRVSTMVQDLKDLLDSLKIRKVHLVGHSFGAHIAVAFAAAHPKMVLSLVDEDMDFTARALLSDETIELYARDLLSLNKNYSSYAEAIHAI